MIQDLLQIVGATIPIQWRRNPKARRYILRVKHSCLVATIPRGGSQREAWDFIQRSQPWIERQLSKPIPIEAVWTPETPIWFRGQQIPIRELNANFPSYNFKNSVINHLQQVAFNELIPRTRELAAHTNTQINRISIRSQRTRWGSCSVRRTISLNWRLIQTPQFVVDYIILHELMHLRQMNHSAKFWREVESVCPTWREAEHWLKKHGREILSG